MGLSREVYIQLHHIGCFDPCLQIRGNLDVSNWRGVVAPLSCGLVVNRLLALKYVAVGVHHVSVCIKAKVSRSGVIGGSPIAHHEEPFSLNGDICGASGVLQGPLGEYAVYGANP